MSRAIQGIGVTAIEITRGEAGVVVACLDATIEDRSGVLDETAIATIRKIRGRFDAIARPAREEQR